MTINLNIKRKKYFLAHKRAPVSESDCQVNYCIVIDLKTNFSHSKNIDSVSSALFHLKILNLPFFLWLLSVVAWFCCLALKQQKSCFNWFFFWRFILTNANEQRKSILIKINLVIKFWSPLLVKGHQKFICYHLKSCKNCL